MSDDLTRREVIEAVKNPTQQAVVIEPSGEYWVAHTIGHAIGAMADREREVAVMSGEGWASLAYLSEPGMRHTEPPPSAPSDAPQMPGDAPEVPGNFDPDDPHKTGDDYPAEADEPEDREGGFQRASELGRWGGR